jgi:hypothetical protein
MQGRSSASQWGRRLRWAFFESLGALNPHPALSLLKREGGEVLCFGGGGPCLSRGFDEKGQGIAAAMPYRTAFLPVVGV